MNSETKELVYNFAAELQAKLNRDIRPCDFQELDLQYTVAMLALLLK